jgi:AcrR family transcriptional regulator
LSTRSGTAPQNSQLDAAAWVEAALDALAEGGVDAVRVDPLAKRLGVTRGSFYWHFKDRAALHQGHAQAMAKRGHLPSRGPIERAAPDAGERLRRTLALPASGPRATRAAAIEMAIRFGPGATRKPPALSSASIIIV